MMENVFSLQKRMGKVQTEGSPSTRHRGGSICSKSPSKWISLGFSLGFFAMLEILATCQDALCIDSTFFSVRYKLVRNSYTNRS